MNRKAITWSMSVALAAGSVPWARADGVDALGQSQSARRVTLMITGAAPADVAHTLGEALGAEVRFDGSVPKTLAFSLSDVPPKVALDKVAEAVAGKWERVYRLAKSDAAKFGPAAPTGLKLSLRLTDVPCADAATMVAHMAGAKIEMEGEVQGTVTLSGADIPVEEALDTIATAAGLTWYPIYLIHAGSNPPPPSKGTTSRPGGAATRPRTGEEEPSPDTIGGSSPSKRLRRDSKKNKPERSKFTQLGALGAKSPTPPPPVDLQKLQDLSMLGVFAGIFGMEDEADRKLQVKRFIAGMESMARKLENYQPRQRVIAQRQLAMQLQTYVDDYALLSHDQKQEVRPLMDYIKKRLEELVPQANPVP